MKYFLVKVNYEKLDQKTGKSKKVTEPYLVDAITFGESEEKIHKKLEDSISGEFKIKTISPSPVSDVFRYENGDKWFKVLVSFVDVDPDSGKAKNVTLQMLVAADNIRDAYNRIIESTSSFIVPIEIPNICDSKIIEIFEHESEKEQTF